jgi:hypothetical protein
MANRSRPVVALSLLAVVGALLLAVLIYKSQQRLAMESLVEFVLKNGDETVVPANVLSYFHLPAEDFRFQEITAESDSGRTRAIQVRRRRDGIVDVFLLDRLANSTIGNFYLSGDHGQLTQAAYFEHVPQEVEDAQEKFHRELSFWKHWQRAQLKR